MDPPNTNGRRNSPELDVRSPDLERDAEGLDAYSDGAGGGNDGDDGFDLDDSLNMTRAGQDLLPPPPDAAAARLSDASLAEAVPATQVPVLHVCPAKVSHPPPRSPKQGLPDWLLGSARNSQLRVGVGVRLWGTMA